jgi:solute carrier family 6 amino acid/orphan transporter-like 15/16/17/18/20
MICWKYISPCAMIIILTASWIKIFTEGSTYPQWDAVHGVARDADWPNWALAIAVFLVLIATFWIPFIAITRSVESI